MAKEKSTTKKTHEVESDKKPSESKQQIAAFFIKNNVTYAELQKVLLIFKLFNLDNDFGQSILDAIEADWLSREPEDGFDDAYLDGLMDGLELAEEIEDEKLQRRRAIQTKLAAAS